MRTKLYYAPLAMRAALHLSPLLGAVMRTRRPVAANDNNPQKTTHMVAYNGGCSTTSGMMPVTLAEVPTLETATVAMSARERLIAANDNEQNEQQVAA